MEIDFNWGIVSEKKERAERGSLSTSLSLSPFLLLPSSRPRSRIWRRSSQEIWTMIFAARSLNFSLSFRDLIRFFVSNFPSPPPKLLLVKISREKRGSFARSAKPFDRLSRFSFLKGTRGNSSVFVSLFSSFARLLSKIKCKFYFSIRYKNTLPPSFSSQNHRFFRDGILLSFSR